MKKLITKAEFIRRVTSRKTIFVGISPSGDETEMVIDSHKYTPRYCVAKANQHLIFGVEPPTEPFVNDSHLYLADVKPHTEIKCYADDDVLVVETKWTDSFDGKVTTKCLYYKEV